MRLCCLVAPVFSFRVKPWWKYWKQHGQPDKCVILVRVEEFVTGRNPSMWQQREMPSCFMFSRLLVPKLLEIHFNLISVWLVCWDVCCTDNLSTPVHASATKAPLVRPDGLFGRGLLVGLPPVPLLADSAASASETVAGCAGVRTPGFFTFFFFLGLWKKKYSS